MATNVSKVVYHLRMGLGSQKCIVKQFHCSGNIIIVCKYTNLADRAYYTPRLYGIAYMLFMGPQSHMWSVVHQNIFI